MLRTTKTEDINMSDFLKALAIIHTAATTTTIDTVTKGKGAKAVTTPNMTADIFKASFLGLGEIGKALSQRKGDMYMAAVEAGIIKGLPILGTAWKPEYTTASVAFVDMIFAAEFKSETISAMRAASLRKSIPEGFKRAWHALNNLEMPKNVETDSVKAIKKLLKLAKTGKLLKTQAEEIVKISMMK
jgi:hypothetical protein